MCFMEREISLLIQRDDHLEGFGVFDSFARKAVLLDILHVIARFIDEEKYSFVIINCRIMNRQQVIRCNFCLTHHRSLQTLYNIMCIMNKDA